MALPTSGQISLNDIHIEAGGSTGTLCTIDDADIRDMISEVAGTEHSFSEWYGASATTVTLSGSAISQTSFTGSVEVGVRINADGTVDAYKTSSGFYQIAATTDWIIPNTGADSTYEVRVTSVVGDTWFTSAAGNDTWIALGSDRYWSIQDAVVGGTQKSVTFTIEIRKDGGAVIASATYTLTANYDQL